MRYHELFEALVSDSIKKSAANHLLDAFDTGYTSTQGVLIKMFEDEFIETFDSKEQRKPEFRTKLQEWCYASIDNMVWTLNSHFKGSVIPIWRMITALSTWHPDPNRHPGIFWTWDKDAAESHWGDDQNGDVEWLLYAEATSEQVNWPVTLSKNCMPDYEDEKEIEIQPVPIKIISYTMMK